MTRIISIFILLGFFALGLTSAPAYAQEPPKVKGRYASIIIDMDNQEIIHARQIDTPRYPASLTKIMTLYLTFEALDRGHLRLDQKLRTSAYAASQPASKLGLRTGETIFVRDAINALIVRSANDVAVVLAEAISGSEADFAYLMTQRARDLGMKRTHFKNPHGLPNKAHVSTARDMAKLADRIIRDHRTYYPLFSQKNFTYKGQTANNTNSLLKDTPGVDGLKTGYTRASGYNLTVSAQRNGRRLVAVVLGGASSKARDTHMRDLVERGFEIILKQKRAPMPLIVKRDPIPKVKPVQTVSASVLRLRDSAGQTQTIIQGQPKVNLPVRSDWSLYFGEFTSARAAQTYLLNITASRPAYAQNIQVYERNNRFQALLKGLNFNQAKPLCEQVKSKDQACLMVQTAAR